MKDNPAPKADGIKYTEIRDAILGSLDGGRPVHSIRKRGFHRALKRGEYWAIFENQTRTMMNSISNLIYSSLVSSKERMNELWGRNKALFTGETISIIYPADNSKRDID